MPHSTEFNYHLLRNALNSFQKNLPELSDEEWQQVEQQASKSYGLESRVLRSQAAASVVIGEAQLDTAVQQVAQRYESHSDFVEDLAANQLDEASLRRALRRELVFDAVMQRVAADVETITETEVDTFYQAHQAKFGTPEKRAVRHILVTLNTDYAENTRAAAQARIEKIYAELDGNTAQFAEFAQRYSECPTAMQGGQLGEVSAGQLYPQLDAVLFAMSENSLSEIVESELGLHILFCEKIIPAQQHSFASVAPKIRAFLEQRQRHAKQKAWLASLPK